MEFHSLAMIALFNAIAKKLSGRLIVMPGLFEQMEKAGVRLAKLMGDASAGTVEYVIHSPVKTAVRDSLIHPAHLDPYTYGSDSFSLGLTHVFK
jgi:hypothetical protein